MSNENNNFKEPYSHTREIFFDRISELDIIVDGTNLPEYRKTEIHENGEVTQEEFNVIKSAAENNYFEYDLTVLLRITPNFVERDYNAFTAAFEDTDNLTHQEYSENNLDEMIDNLKKIGEIK